MRLVIKHGSNEAGCRESILRNILLPPSRESGGHISMS